MLFERMVDRLMELDDLQWGEYMLSKDIWYKKIPTDRRESIVMDSQAAGKRAADKIIVELQTRNINKITEYLHIREETFESLNQSDIQIFAQYIEPDVIRLNKKCIEAAKTKIADIFPKYKNIICEDIFLAHELFHLIEYRNPGLKTNNMKAVYVKLGGFCWSRKLLMPSEIAAMAFAEELLQLSYNPQILDVLLWYAVSQKKAEDLALSILKHSNRR